MANTSILQVLFDEIPPDYDRKQELKAFDDTKAGVRGLEEAGVTKIPRMFYTPPDGIDIRILNSSDDGEAFKIPVIDLGGINIGNNIARRKIVIDEVRHAAETWGFFQIVNHGIPLNMIDGIHERVRRFSEEPKEERSKFYTRDLTKKVVYNCNFDLFRAPSANWRDTLSFMIAPDSVTLEELPPAFSLSPMIGLKAPSIGCWPTMLAPECLQHRFSPQIFYRLRGFLGLLRSYCQMKILPYIKKLQ